MTETEARYLLPGCLVNCPVNAKGMYLLEKKLPDGQMVLQDLATGERMQVHYQEVGRAEIICAGQLIKIEFGDTVYIGFSNHDIWLGHNSAGNFFNCIDMKTGKFTQADTDQTVRFSVPTVEERRKYCEFMTEEIASKSENEG